MKDYSEKTNSFNLGLVLIGALVIGIGSIAESFADVQVDVTKNADSSGCEISEKCYSQHGLIIKAGETVTWVNYGKKPHSIVSGSPELGDFGLFNSGVIIPDKSFSHKFTEQGQFFYFCKTHPWMKGIVMVR